jgi:D-alanyl-D-alanine carboxypeptidase
VTREVTDTAWTRTPAVGVRTSGRGQFAVNGDGMTETTTRRLARRIATPAVAVVMATGMAAAPAHAAVPDGAAAPVQAAERAQAGGDGQDGAEAHGSVVAQGSAAATANAGATWSRLMQRKLNLEIEARRLGVLLPGMRATTKARGADLSRAQQAQAAAVAPVTAATAADEKARASYAAAQEAVVAAKRALSAAKKHRPKSSKRIMKARKALAAAQGVVEARAGRVRGTAAELKAARAAHALAAEQVGVATAAFESAGKAVAVAEQKIIAMPQATALLAARATALSAQVVAQARPTFTVAQTTKVYGVTVNRIVAYPFQRMIDDAAKAGVRLSGGGFRTKQRQIQLRKINGCPDVWTAPASSCRVPTAIPGRSLHELGLAIDISSGGKSITSRKSKPFKWLAANAGRYGLVNLPSEPWHWSITGG